MAWTRGSLAALAVCVLLVTGSAGCGSGAAQERQDGKGVSTSPVGKVLEDTDEAGRHYREVGDKDAPEVGIEVQPDGDDNWDVRLRLRHFRLSPAGTRPKPVAGRGVALLLVDRHPVARLRTPEYRLPAGYLPHGTHHVTARLYADDGTVWAVDGDPVESTADITASAPSPTAPTSPGGAGGGSGTPSAEGALRVNRTTGASVTWSTTISPLRIQGRGFPGHGGKAS